ncbi:MAG: GNAT family N-acetyltransferase [Gemmobacter sp.]
MTPQAMAALHARAFADQRPWSEAEFAGLVASPHTVVLAEPMGFLLGRVVAGEAEVLTLAVEPAARRQGHGTALLARFLALAVARGAVQAFLDVAADNAPALALYARAGFAVAGRRRGYFARPHGPAADAIVMSRALPDS